MQNRIKLIFISFLLFFCFLILFEALKNSNIYVPDKVLKKSLPKFKSQDLNLKKEISSDELFVDSEFYLLNIWASWCLPCRKEHSILMELSRNPKIKLIGLNYKDKFTNAKKFIDEFGNPYSDNMIDTDGTISIELGAYGIPETFIINKNKKIIKKYIGPLDQNSLNEINIILK